MTVVLVLNGPATAGERAVLARREVPLLREIATRGVRATVVLCGDAGGLAADFESAGVPVEVIPVPMAPQAGSLRALPAAVRRLRALIERLGPDLVEATEPMPTIAAGLAARRRSLVIYRRQHQQGSWKLVAASRAAARLSSLTAVSSETMRRIASEADRVPLERVLVASPGYPEHEAVSPDAVQQARLRLGLAEGGVVVGAVSRLRWEKGLDVLIAAAEALGRNGDVHVVIAGTGREERRLREAARRGRAHIHFLGHCDDVAVWYALAQVIAIPSRRESFGRTTVEAMAAGRAIVASRVGGLPEAIRDGETGLLVPPDDPAALAGALRRILDDGALAQRLGRAARLEYEARFTIAHMATSRCAMWEQALRQAAP